MHIFLSGEDNPAPAPPMVNFTHTGYHKSTRSAAFGRISVRGIGKGSVCLVYYYMMLAVGVSLVLAL